MNTHLGQDGIDQLALEYGEVGICVRVVMLVGMIRTHLPATLRAKSYPGTLFVGGQQVYRFV